MKTIRWGIAGPGTIANKFAKAVKNVEGAALVAAASRSLDKSQKFAEMWGIPTAFSSYEQLAQSDEVDAVYVSTIHPFHQSCAELFLKAGKHVLCEKPLCVNEKQARQLQQCAEENGVFLMEAMWTRFLPAVREALSIVQSGMIGDVMGLEADFCYASSPAEEEKLFDANQAGGSLLDVGIYGLHFASVFLGKDPKKVSVVSHVEDGVDLHTQVTLQYESGAMATITSAIGLQKPESAYIYGTKGYLYLPTFYGAQELTLCKDGNETKILKPSIGEGFEEEIMEVCDCIRADKTQSDALPLEETIRIIRMMDGIRKIIGVRYPMD